MGEVNTTFTSDSASLDKVMHRLEQQNIKLIEQNRQLAAMSQQGHSQAVSGAERVIGSLVTMAASYLTVQSAVQAVTAALKDQEEQQQKNQGVTVDASKTQREMFRNLGKVTLDEQIQFESRLKKIGDELTPEGGMTALYQIAGNALSAGGGGPSGREAALKAVKEALRLAPDNVEVATQVAGAIIDLSKATGSSSAIENLGYLKNYGDTARVPEWAKIAKTLSGAVQSATDKGFTPQEAGALLATITQISTDTEGRRSVTALLQLAPQLEAFLPKEDRYAYKDNAITGLTKKTLVRKGTGMTTATERREYLMSNKQERDTFLDALSVETKQRAAIEQWLTSAENKAGQFYAENMKVFGVPMRQMGEDASTAITQWDQNFQQRTDKAKRSSEWTEKESRRTTTAGREGSINAEFTEEELDKQLAAAGRGWFGRQGDVYTHRYARSAGISQEESYSQIVTGLARQYEQKPIASKQDFPWHRYTDRITSPEQLDKLYSQYVKDSTAAPEDVEFASTLTSGLAEKRRLAALQREAAEREQSTNQGTAASSPSNDATVAILKEVRDEIRGLRRESSGPTPAAVQSNARRGK